MLSATTELPVVYGQREAGLVFGWNMVGNLFKKTWMWMLCKLTDIHRQVLCHQCSMRCCEFIIVFSHICCATVSLCLMTRTIPTEYAFIGRPSSLRVDNSWWPFSCSIYRSSVLCYLLHLNVLFPIHCLMSSFRLYLKKLNCCAHRCPSVLNYKKLLVN